MECSFCYEETEVVSQSGLCPACQEGFRKNRDKWAAEITSESLKCNAGYDPNLRLCTCGSGQTWVDCTQQSPYCG